MATGRAVIVAVEVTTVKDGDGADLKPLKNLKAIAKKFAALLGSFEVTWPAADHDSVLGALRTAAAATKSDDILLFLFLGHGLEGAGDSSDLTDTRLVLTSSVIVDDELREIWTKDVKASGARILSIVDACHSGTSFHVPPALIVQVWRRALAALALGRPVECKPFVSTEAIIARLVHFGSTEDAKLTPSGRFTDALVTGMGASPATYSELLEAAATSVVARPECWYWGTDAEKFLLEQPLAI